MMLRIDKRVTKRPRHRRVECELCLRYLPLRERKAFDNERETELDAMHEGQLAFQDFYPDDLSHCYGCGRLNTEGHQIKTYWEGEESVTLFTPKPYHIAIPGYVYGGLIASLIDCHGTGTAAAAMFREEGREMGTEPAYRFVTASLKVDYLKPIPLGEQLEIRGRVKEISRRKVIVTSIVSVKGEVSARGEVVAVQMPEHFKVSNRVK